MCIGREPQHGDMIMDSASGSNTVGIHNKLKYFGRKTWMFNVEFRSQLEAQWATFFTLLGIRWEYEQHKVNTRHGGYIPDFHLPDLHGGLICEVKPHGREEEDFNVTEEKLSDACVALKKSGTVLRGSPYKFCVEDVDNVEGSIFDRAGGSHDLILWMDGEFGWDNGHAFCVCPYCWRAGYEYSGRGERVCKGSCGQSTVVDGRNFDHLGHGDKAYSAAHPRIRIAAKAAQDIIRQETR